jgi:hypothetical protein
MSVRVWQSQPPDKDGMYADWEMECAEHGGRTTTGAWAMEAAWGHIAMHHGKEAS